MGRIWNRSIVILVPIGVVGTARRVVQAMDPDVGGFDSFNLFFSGSGEEPAEWAGYYSKTYDEFVNIVTQLLTKLTPIQVAGYVSGQLAIRFPEISSDEYPDETELTLFLSQAVIAFDQDLTNVSSSLELNPIVFEEPI